MEFIKGTFCEGELIGGWTASLLGLIISFQYLVREFPFLSLCELVESVFGDVMVVHPV